MSTRKNIAAGGKWDDIIGYSRAVIVGNTMEISGTVAADENGVVGKGDFYAQTKFVIEKLEKVLQQGGFTLADVVRTRIFMTDIAQWEQVAKAHGEFFKTIKPVTTMVGGSTFIGPDYLVEIEMTAVKA